MGRRALDRNACTYTDISIPDCLLNSLRPGYLLRKIEGVMLACIVDETEAFLIYRVVIALLIIIDLPVEKRLLEAPVLLRN